MANPALAFRRAAHPVGPRGAARGQEGTALRPVMPRCLNLACIII